jgi:hypothetical protein
MTALNRLAWLVGLLLAAGEIARYWGSPHVLPAALDEMAVAAALIWAAMRDRAVWHVAAWSALSGLVAVLLAETADHQVHGPVKANGAVYLAALGTLLAVGLWAVARAVRLVRR